jgi:hypothetical protein
VSFERSQPGGFTTLAHHMVPAKLSNGVVERGVRLATAYVRGRRSTPMGFHPLRYERPDGRLTVGYRATVTSTWW